MLGRFTKLVNEQRETISNHMYVNKFEKKLSNKNNMSPIINRVRVKVMVRS
jgi:hypothetical protein